jgi:BMFP domain-containing protein YqiC
MAGLNWRSASPLSCAFLAPTEPGGEFCDDPDHQPLFRRDRPLDERRRRRRPGVKREVDTVMRNQAERILRDLDVVKREEFDAVKDMARLAREENEALKARIAALEARLGGTG